MEAETLEKFYSVAVEMQDGNKRVLPVRGRTPGGVFQQVKGRPDVRRVGKVTEITRADYDALHAGKALPPSPSHRGEHPSPSAKAEHRSGGEHRPGNESGGPTGVATLLRGITGPRVVRHTRPTGGEQPFRHLQAPPERPKPPEPPKPVKVPPPPRPPVVAAPAVAAPVQAAPVQPVEPTVAEQPDAARPARVGREYRIVKSRRQNGEPYLLQRGYWHQPKGKRVFEVQWEKGFANREAAERHQGWLEQHERELAEANQQVQEV